MIRKYLILLAVIPAACILQPPRLHAETPSASYIFPAGGQQGTTVNINVGGHYLHDVCSFQIFGPGVDAPREIQRATSTRWFEGPVIPLPDSQQKENYPKDQAGRITIASDASPGFRYWRVWTSQGGSESMKFVVGNLPEIVEMEIDGVPIPTAVAVPVTINGRIFPREDVDVWTFEGRAGQSYTCEVIANRIGSPLDSRLEVIGPNGTRIAENTDGIGTDSFLRFSAPEDGVYQVRIHDINFDGLQHFVYRLTITDGAYVDHIYPLGGRRGSLTRFQLYGQNIADGPRDTQLPTSAGNSWMHSIEQQGKTSNQFAIQLSDTDEQVESEPNDTPSNAPKFSVPTVLNGRIELPGDIDTWQFSAKKDEVLALDVYAERLGSVLDSVLVVYDSDGKELARNDDIDSKHTDSAIEFTAPADGTYSVSVSERFDSRGGLRFAYRLHVSPPETADFKLTMPVESLNVNRSGEIKVKIAVTRIAGYAGDIAIKLENLPPGVTVVGDKIDANKNDLELVFKAEATAEIGPFSVQVIGEAQIAGQTVSHSAMKLASSSHDMDVDRLLLFVAMPTPFKFAGAFQTTYAARGSTFQKHFTIDRSGFTGPIEISLADRQTRHLQGVTGPTIVVPAGESEFDYSIKLPSWMEVGRTSRTCLMATGVVEEPNGRHHKVCYASDQQNDQLIVLVDPGQLEVRVQPKSVLAIPGGSARVRIEVGRGKSVNLPVTAELHIPDHVRGVTAEPVIIEPDQSTGTLEIHFTKEQLGPFNMPISIVATALPHGHPYTAEDTIEIVLPQSLSE